MQLELEVLSGIYVASILILLIFVVSAVKGPIKMA